MINTPDQDRQPHSFIRFGIQRKKEFLKDVRNTYDGLVLPGNILLYQYRSTPTTIFMCERKFFVDPMSYLFGQPYEGLKQRLKKGLVFKPSFDKLMVGHGLKPADFLQYDYTKLIDYLSHPKDNISNFANNALNFQWETVWNTIKEAKDLMTDEERENLEEDKYRPVFIIPPYFLFEPGSATNDLNRRIIEYCWRERTKWKGDLFPMLFIRKKDLASDFLDEAISIVKGHPFLGYCVWVEDFDERQATRSQAGGLIKLISTLSKENQQVVMLYGGYFSMLLYHFGLSCICHGLAYGEARSVTATAQKGSGPAPIRYYVLELHRFLTLPDALIILRKRPDLICNCPICQRVIQGNPDRVIRFESEEALSEMHFLWNRAKERRIIAQASIDDLIEDLDMTLILNKDLAEITKTYKVYGGYEERPIIDPIYISEWKAALEEKRNTAT